jgi:hypothetical protein
VAEDPTIGRRDQDRTSGTPAQPNGVGDPIVGGIDWPSLDDLQPHAQDLSHLGDRLDACHAQAARGELPSDLPVPAPTSTT